MSYENNFPYIPTIGIYDDDNTINPYIIGVSVLSYGESGGISDASELTYSSDVAKEHKFQYAEEAFDHILTKPVGYGAIDFNFKYNADEMWAQAVEGELHIEKALLVNSQSIDILFSNKSFNIAQSGIVTQQIVIPANTKFVIRMHRINEGVAAEQAGATLLYKVF